MFMGEQQAQNIFNTNFFENEIFFNEKFPDYGIMKSINADKASGPHWRVEVIVVPKEITKLPVFF